jgi:hypothetical protein
MRIMEFEERNVTKQNTNKIKVCIGLHCNDVGVLGYKS